MSALTFTIAVKDGNHTRGEVVEIDEDASAEELARCTDLAHEMLSVLERALQRRAKRREERKL